MGELTPMTILKWLLLPFMSGVIAAASIWPDPAQ
jgi:hypothetical protein